MIELRHLRYFVAVAEELNFRRAAERVHIDQTPLSRAIRDLEDRLGLPLFIRGTRSLRLTPGGLRLLEEAKNLFISLDRTYRAVRETDSRFRAPLRLGVADGIAQPKLSDCLIRWGKMRPEVPLELVELRASELKVALEREELDAGLSFGLPADDSISQHAIWNYPLVALLPAAHELASNVEVSMIDVLAFPLLTWNPTLQPGLAHQLINAVRKHTMTATIAGEAGTWAGYVTRIAAGFAVGIVDAGHASTLCRGDVVIIPIRETERITTFLLHQNHRSGGSADLQRFVATASAL